MTVEAIGTIVGVSLSLLTVIVFPIYRKIKKDIKAREDQKAKVANNEKQLELNIRRIASLETSVTTILKNQDRDRQEALAREIRDIKVYINDIYYSYKTVQEIPNEMFINGFNLCARYLELGQNHEMKPICKSFADEYTRRVKNHII